MIEEGEFSAVFPIYLAAADVSGDNRSTLIGALVILQGGG
ncbi:MAG: hypothetical protein C5S48_08755 [Candidatus Methanogaster sp.]|nr:MAG: hypothetical protein C5S48_08755 [ANME-2 cluster archaeon]